MASSRETPQAGDVRTSHRNWGKAPAALHEKREVLLSRLRRIAEHSPPRSRYLELDPIGRGGMGEVVRVWDNDLGRELAMKRITLPDGPDSPTEREEHEALLALFIEEAQITAQLDHPGIVPVHEISVDREGVLSFTMPLVRGQDLDATLQLVRDSEDGWNRPRVLNVLLKVCDAVTFAHSKGVIHRDLKPSNIMVGPFGEAYVMDWGLAWIPGRSAAAGVVGTPAFMSPEQAGLVEAEVGPRSDVYSLGAILYQILTDRMPHEHSQMGAGAWPSAPPTPLHRLDPDLSPELVAICEKAMRVQPSERYATVKAFADDLRANLEGHVVRAYESGPWARARKWIGRNRGLTWALEALLLLGIVATVAVLYVQDEKVRALRSQNQIVQREQYAANLRAADLGLRILNTLDASARLSQTPEHLRGWEWEHLQLKLDSSLTRVSAGTPLRWAGRLADGRMATLRDGGVDLWDLDTRRKDTLVEEAIRSLAVDPAGRLIATGSATGTVTLRELDSGSRRTFEASRVPIDRLVFAPSKNLLAVADEAGRLQLFDLTERPPTAVLELSQDTTPALAFSGDARWLWVTDRDAVELWDTTRGVRVATSPMTGESLLSIAAHPDGNRVAVGAIDHTIRILDGTSLVPERELAGHGDGVVGLAFDATGLRLASASHDGTIRIWNMESMAEETQLLGHLDGVSWVEFAPDGKVLSTSMDGSLRSWNPDLRACTVLRGHEAQVSCVHFPGTSERLVTSSLDGSLRTWDLNQDRPGVGLAGEESVFTLACSPDGSLAAIPRGREVQILSLENERELFRLAGHGAQVQVLAFGPRGKRLLTRAFDGLRLWDLEERREILRLPLEEDWGGPIAFHPGGDAFAAGSMDGRIRIWEADEGSLAATLLDAEGGSIWALAFSNSGDRLAASNDGYEIVLWERKAPGKWRRVEVAEQVEGEQEDESASKAFQGHGNLIRSLAFSPDDERLVSGSTDCTVRVWHPDSGELLLTLEGHLDAVTSISFSPDGKKIASSSSDHTVRVWNTRPASPGPGGRRLH